jgi:hypothetical protein
MINGSDLKQDPDPGLGRRLPTRSPRSGVRRDVGWPDPTAVWSSDRAKPLRSQQTNGSSDRSIFRRGDDVDQTVVGM